MTDEGYVKAQSDNLPTVDAFMIAEFFSNSEVFISAEIRGIKADSAGRQSYGDAAVRYVQMKRESTLCTVKAKVCPEHKVRNKNFTVSITVNEAEEIINALCHDCAASLVLIGGCKHSIALIMWVHRRSEEPAPTEMECYWKKSKLSSVGTSSIKYVTVQDFGTVKEQLPNPSNGDFFKKFVELGAKKGVASHILKYFVESKSLNCMGIHHLFSMFCREVGENAEDFLNFAKERMTTENCRGACEAISQQSNCKLWHELRYGRLTASRLYEAARCKTAAGTLVETVIGSLKIKETQAMKRGRILEKKVTAVLEKELKVKLRQTGILLSAEYPYLGASPDAVADNFVVEIKCPSSLKTFTTYIKDGKISNKYNAQIQLQMYLFKKQKGVFCVADPSFEVNNKIHGYNIDFDAEFIQAIMDCAKIFFR